MYTFVFLMYFFAAMLAIFTFSMVINFNMNNGEKHMLAFMACACVQTVGYLFELMATTMDGAYIAFRMQYFAACYALLFCLEFVYFFCRVDRPKLVLKLLAVIDTIILVTQWFNDKVHFFYRSVKFVETGDHPHLEVEYGPGYGLYMVFCVVVPMIWALLIFHKNAERRQLSKFKIQSRIIAIMVVLGLFVVFGGSFITQKEYDFYPLVLCVEFSSLVLLIFRKYNVDFMALSAKSLNEILDEIVIITDDSGKITDYNEVAKNVLGDTMQDQVTECYNVFRGNGEGEQNGTVESEQGVFDVRMKPMRDRNGILQGYLYLGNDVTQMHKSMEELRELKELAEEANQSKSAFLSNMSHEIRTPMNSIIGMTEILLRGEHNPEDTEYLLNIQNSGNSLISIINDILDFSKIESGKMELVEKNYEVASVLNDLSLMFLNRIGGKPIELLFDIDPRLPKVLHGDEVRVRQCIVNLVNNAIKFTDEGCIRMQIGCDFIEKDQVKLTITVSDTGWGIKEEDMERMFDSFQRVNAEKTHAKEGSGLGLSITKSLVELMNGSISVSSEYGKGSEFQITLYQGVASELPYVEVKKEQAFGKKMCIVTENPYTREICKKLCEAYHMEFVTMEEAKKTQQLIDFVMTEPENCRMARSELHADKVLVLYNPMLEKPALANVTLISKPLYAYNLSRIWEKKKEGDVRKREFAVSAPDASVLVVDDNIMNQRVAIGLLRPMQMNIDTAENGQQAIEMIQKKRYDLVLMDHMMPVMDGIEATKLIRQMESDYYKKLPIVALTANAIVGVKDTFLEAGMNDFVTKPIVMEELVRAIITWLPKDKLIEKQDHATVMQVLEYMKEAIQEKNMQRITQLYEDLSDMILPNTVSVQFSVFQACMEEEDYGGMRNIIQGVQKAMH